MDIGKRDVYVATRYPSGKGLAKIAITKNKVRLPIDMECAVEAGDVIESFDDGSALIKECTVMPEEGDKRKKVTTTKGKKKITTTATTKALDCDKGVIYVESDPDRTEWKHRVALYSALSDSPELAKHTIPIATTWFCDGNPITGFCVSEIPSGYKFFTLRRFLNSRNKKATFSSSGIPILVDRLINYGVLPDVVSANSYGVLVPDNPARFSLRENVSADDENSERPIPVLIPLPKKMVIVPAAAKSALAPEVKRLIQVDTKKTK